MHSRISEVLQANRSHQEALRAYVDEIQAKLSEVDDLLELAQADEDEPEHDVNVGGYIMAPGAALPQCPWSPSEIVDDTSPFHADTLRRGRYMDIAESPAMSKQTLDALQEAVRTENYRLQAYELQRRGEQALDMILDKASDQLLQNTEGIDWSRVAEQISGPGGTYTATECMIRWLASSHPKINHSAWTSDETAKVKNLVGDMEDGEVDWEVVAKQLGTGRNALDCMRHAQSRRTHIWNAAFDGRLTEAVELYGTDNWYLVARFVSETAAPTQCEARWSRVLSPTISRDAWTPEEDDRLRQAFEVYGKSWSDVAALIAGRTNHQCSDRWDTLSIPLAEGGVTPASQHAGSVPPDVGKAPSKRWSKREERALWETVRASETRKWAQIAAKLGNTRVSSAYQQKFRQLEKKMAQEPSYLDSSDPDDSPAEAEAATRPKARQKRRPAKTPDDPPPDDDIPMEDAAPQPTRRKPRPRPVAKKAVTTSQAEDAASQDAQLGMPGGNASLELLSTVAMSMPELQTEAWGTLETPPNV